MGGLLESIAHFGHHHLDAYRCFRYRKAGRQIDGNQVRAAIDAIGRIEVAENVRVNEPGTIGFFVSQEQENPSVFTTYERFLDQAAMDAHNDSQVVARFFGIAKPILDGDVILVTSTEISAKA